jgi:hypothetical protein
MTGVLLRRVGGDSGPPCGPAPGDGPGGTTPCFEERPVDAVGATTTTPQEPGGRR